MISIPLFLIALCVLVIEGFLLARLIVPSADRLLRLTFALPLTAVSNVLLVFLYTVLKIPLTPVTMGAGHLMIIGALFLTIKKRAWIRDDPGCVSGSLTVTRFLFRSVCILLLSNIFLYSATHALVLHSFSIDSLTNWTMRAKISFEDRAIAFDRNEDRGMAKPQYPFLTHALQIAMNQGRPHWSDRAANVATWLLSLSTFSAFFLILRSLRGTDAALLTLTLILSIPLLSIHLAQGYGDIHLVEYLLLGMMTFSVSLGASKNISWLLLSSIFILGSMWTKSEGLFFGFLPWTLLMIIHSLKTQNSPLRQGFEGQARLKTLSLALLPLLLFLPFLIFLRLTGLPFTPHGTDATFGFHPEGLRALWPSLFGLGSFGIVWYALPPATLLLLLARWRKSDAVEHIHLPLLLWGWLIVLQNLVIYLFTPNVAFLLSGESFFRQMLPAAALIILACVLIMRPNPNPNPNPNA